MSSSERLVGSNSEILLISHARIPTVRLLEQILSHVAASCDGTLRSRTMANLSLADLRPRTVPLFARVDSIPSHRLAMLMHKVGIGYWYYLDDNFWELDPGSEIGQYYRDPGVQRRLEELLEHADRILVSTTALRDYLHRFGDRVVQIDSFFDFSLVPELPAMPSARPFIRGGFASSADRGVDLLPVLPDLLTALDRNDKFEFELIGPDFDAIEPHPRIRRFPVLTDYESYVRFQLDRQWDFAIAPLSGVRSNIYKTDNKYREYAALGIPGIYQESLPYESVVDGETGLIVSDEGRSWLDAIDLYVTSPELRQKVRTQARADVVKRRSIETVSIRWAAEFSTAPQMGSAAGLLRRSVVRQMSTILLRTWWGSLRHQGPIATARRTTAYLAKRMRRIEE